MKLKFTMAELKDLHVAVELRAESSEDAADMAGRYGGKNDDEKAAVRRWRRLLRKLERIMEAERELQRLQRMRRKLK